MKQTARAQIIPRIWKQSIRRRSGCNPCFFVIILEKTTINDWDKESRHDNRATKKAVPISRDPPERVEGNIEMMHRVSPMRPIPET